MQLSNYLTKNYILR